MVNLSSADIEAFVFVCLFVLECLSTFSGIFLNALYQHSSETFDLQLRCSTSVDLAFQLLLMECLDLVNSLENFCKNQLSKVTVRQSKVGKIQRGFYIYKPRPKFQGVRFLSLQVFVWSHSPDLYNNGKNHNLTYLAVREQTSRLAEYLNIWGKFLKGVGAIEGWTPWRCIVNSK